MHRVRVSPFIVGSIAWVLDDAPYLRCGATPSWSHSGVTHICRPRFSVEPQADGAIASIEEPHPCGATHLLWRHTHTSSTSQTLMASNANGVTPSWSHILGALIMCHASLVTISTRLIQPPTWPHEPPLWNHPLSVCHHSSVCPPQAHLGN